MTKPTQPGHDEHRDGTDHQHHHDRKPYRTPGWDKPHRFDPPTNPRYPDREIYGSYASEKPPRYVPHPYDHAAFLPREEDYRPPVTCEDEADGCTRKDHRRLTTDEQSRFLAAYTQVDAMGALGPLVDIHANSVHQMHRNPRFLPWHRVYLLRLEALLHQVDPSVCIPYWNSSDEQAFPAWLAAFTPTVTLASGAHTVSRTPGMFSSLPGPASLAAVDANSTFDSFAQDLEGVHDSGHVWVGGSMQLVATAPTDPIFWMHHAEIDRRWHLWQQAHPGEHPGLSGTAATMDPWSETEPDTRDIAALGYAYA